MSTILQKLQSDVLYIKDNLKILLLQHSQVGKDVNENSPIFYISTSGNRLWEDLKPDGKVFRNFLYKEFNRILELWDYLIEPFPDDLINNYKEYKKEISDSILQTDTTWSRNTQEAFLNCERALVGIYDLFLLSVNAKAKNDLYVLDTSALIHNPDIEDWKFDQVEKFTLVVPITVIQELDSYEMSNKNDIVKTKAKKILNKIRNLSLRGKLSDGVNVRDNKIFFQTLPFEVSIPKVFSLMNTSNNDDKIFSTFLYTIRENVNSTVTLITRDTGLFVKANHYGLPSEQPPDPIEKR